MTYQEILDRFGGSEELITYSDLLEADEWNNIRTSIIRRDDNKCQKCGRTKSFYFNNIFNIAIDKDDRIIPHSIKYLDISLSQIKNEKEFETILITISPSNEPIGISENGIFFLVGQLNQIKEQQKTRIVINSAITEKNRPFYLLGVKSQEYQEYNFAIPILCEQPLHLHVHHNYYIIENLPWEYDNSVFITLCGMCHNDLHKNSTVPIYTKRDGFLERLNYTPCCRCNGTGYFQEYRHIENGICFRCQGARYEELIKKPPAANKLFSISGETND
jgi:hypothetical protein